MSYNAPTFNLWGYQVEEPCYVCGVTEDVRTADGYGRNVCRKHYPLTKERQDEEKTRLKAKNETFVDKVEELRKYIARQGMSKEALARTLAALMHQVAPDFKEGVDQAEELDLARKTISNMMSPGGKERFIDIMKECAVDSHELDDDWKELEQ